MHFHKYELKNDEVPSQISRLVASLQNYVIVKDGTIIQEILTKDYQNLSIRSMEEVLAESPDLLDQTLDSDIDDEAYLYNKEECNSGLVIQVGRNKAYQEPLYIFYIQEETEMVHHTHIELEQNSEFHYFEYIYNESEASINFVSNSFVSENAKLVYGGLTKLSEKAMVSMVRNSFVKRYGNASYSVAEVNGGTTISNTNIKLLEPYASGTTKTVAITNKEQEASFRQLVEHQAEYTEGYIENYGVSNNKSTLVFEGVGKINKNMKRSIARQSNRGIVLGENSRLDANPLLLIDEFDVEASHGAAIGKIDEEQLYYLMSRGLTLKNAERLIINGFLSPVLSLLKTDELIEDFVLTVEEKTL